MIKVHSRRSGTDLYHTFTSTFIAGKGGANVTFTTPLPRANPGVMRGETRDVQYCSKNRMHVEDLPLESAFAWRGKVVLMSGKFRVTRIWNKSRPWIIIGVT